MPRRFSNGRHALRDAELGAGEADPAFPLKPQHIVADIRKAMGDDDIVLVDTGALKMWLVRLYPTSRRLTCLISNDLSTMAFALPGALGDRLAPGRLCREHAAHGQARPAHHGPVTRDPSGRGDAIIALVSSIEPAVSPYGHDVNITTPE